MIFRLAFRSLLAHPIRSLVLSCGFGLGVGVMATLLGVGEVILDQARSPALSGGGDVVLTGAVGQIPAAKWVLSSALHSGSLASRVVASSPSRRATLYLIRDGRHVSIRARGGIPSLERALGDGETSAVAGWDDERDDRLWASPDPAAALRALDRFHQIPVLPSDIDGSRDDEMRSWAEWLYFNGRAGEIQFYLTFLAGPKERDGTRGAGVRLQLDRAGVRSSYSMRTNLDEADLLRSAPDLTIGPNRVRLNGLRYEIALDLPRQVKAGDRLGSGDGPRVRGNLVLEATAGRAIPPLTLHGIGGWVSGYVVPVMSGTLSGTLALDGQIVRLEGGTGYHDHNWGFWKGVSWRWGQVHHGDISVVYGRINPPAHAADAERIPGFLAVLGPGGVLGYATRVAIEETDDPRTGQPARINISARGPSIDLALDLAIEDVIVTRGGDLFAADLDFLQLRARYHVRGVVDGRQLDFTAGGSAETFRNGSP
jgi:hypothetical protein